MTTLRKTTTREAQWAVATYEVLEDGNAIGTVTKYDMPGERNVGSRRRPHYTPRRVVRWTADTGAADEELHERRRDAVDMVTLMHERTKAATFEVKRWQTYVPCRPPSYAYPGKPFVVTAVDGDRVEVWDPTGGQRMGGSRWVARKNLHETGTTQHGKERLTGWRLHCEAPADPVKKELCGSCFTWKDRDEFAVLAHGFGHSTCKPCKAEIEEMYSIASTEEGKG